jgi:isopentenyl-diphosphate delta-isomerase
MNPEELLQIVDAETGEPTGELLQRKEALAKHRWCRSTNIYVLNTSGEILCHQRSTSKERFPGIWSTHFGGHVTGGESFKINALKELEEEIGLRISPYQIIPWRTSKKEAQHLWMRDFITVYDGELKHLKLQESEIQQVKWHNVDEILSFLDTEGDDTNTNWLAGTHDFHADYQCMRAVLTAALDAGLFGDPYKHLRYWEPAKKNS